MTTPSMARIGLGAAVLATAASLALTTTPASAAVVQITAGGSAKGSDFGFHDGILIVRAIVDSSDPVSFSDNGIPMLDSPVTPSATCSTPALCANAVSEAVKGIHHIVVQQGSSQVTATYLVGTSLNINPGVTLLYGSAGSGSGTSGSSGAGSG